jgi:uncharacterized protein (UPF0264 family)
VRLLVSVANAAEARDALAGGADIIDAKDPLAGALGPVPLDALEEICAAVAGRRPVSAALGDVAAEAAAERAARTCAARGVAFVKIGLAGITAVARAERLVRAAVHGASAGPCGVVGVAYADATQGSGLSARAVAGLCARAGAAGVLLDTADKRGPGLRTLVEPRALAGWVARARARGLFVALAGKLAAVDLPFAGEMGADIAGVRGAACDGGRTGRVSVENVMRLRALVPAEAACPRRLAEGATIAETASRY